MADAPATAAPPAAPAAPPAAPAATPPEDTLGDPGKRALEAEREARKAAEKQARDFQAELDKLKQQTMSETEKAIAAAKAEGRTEALKDANARLLAAEIKVAAAGKLADPADAAALLGDVTRFVGDDGSVDSKAIKSAIDKLVQDKPYLAAAPGKGAGEGGPRGGGATPPGLNEDPLLDSLKAKLGIPQ